MKETEERTGYRNANKMVRSILLFFKETQGLFVVRTCQEETSTSRFECPSSITSCMHLSIAINRRWDISLSFYIAGLHIQPLSDNAYARYKLAICSR